MKKLSILWNVFVRDFRKQSGRMTLTIIGLLWGTISIMLLLSFGEGLYQQMTKNQKGMGEGFAIIWGGQTNKEFKGLPRGRRIMFRSTDLEYFQQKMPDVKLLTGELMRWGQRISYKKKYVSNMVNGLYPEYENLRAMHPQMGGRFINHRDVELKRRVVFLGDETKEELMPDVEDPIGEMIFINDVPFTVIGVMAPKQQISSYASQDARNVFIPVSTYQAMWNEPYYDNLLLALHPKDYYRMDEFKERMNLAAAAKYKYDPDDKVLGVWDVIRSQQDMANMLLGLKYFLGFVGFMTLLIAGVGVANIMYVSVKERTREIGIKMAMGARRATILWQFVTEALFITFTGGLLGMMLIYCLTESLKILPIENDVLNFMGRPTVSLVDGLIIIVILGTMGVLSGYFPARKAASVTPVESLRYE
ncbi:MAG: ABC transporter permease [candidate division Zixibacteria bacterium]|nr:ABC transporter permease [candidate division Zixibacteria bacterium]